MILISIIYQEIKDLFYIFPAFIETKKGKFVMHGLIRLVDHTWPDMKIVEKLRTLPPAFAVNVDPVASDEP